MIGIDTFNLLDAWQPPTKQKTPQADIIQVIPSDPGIAGDNMPSAVDLQFQAILDRALGINTSQAPVSAQNPATTGQGKNVNSGASPGVTGGSGNNLFNFFSEAGVVYIVGAILVGVAFVILRK